MIGYIKDHRKELESDVWQMPPLYHRTWQWLKYNVNHSDNEIPMRDGSRMLIRRGQRLTSVREMAKHIGWYEGRKRKEPNPKTVAAILEWMEKTSMISLERGKGNREYTLITLINYDIYNAKDEQGNGKVTPDGQASTQRADINKNDKNEQSKDPRPKPQKQVYDEESIPYRSANYLLTNILKFKPDLKQPDLQSWADDMRKLIEIDNRKPHEVAQVIEWATTDVFWQTVILSASNLRKRWDTLTAKMNQPTGKKSNKNVIEIPIVTTSSEESEHLAEMARRQAAHNLSRVNNH